MKKILLLFLASLFSFSVSAQEMKLAATIYSEFVYEGGTHLDGYVTIGIETHSTTPLELAIDTGDGILKHYTTLVLPYNPSFNKKIPYNDRGSTFKIYADNLDNINKLTIIGALEIELSYMPNLSYFSCREGGLTEINLQNVPMLQELQCPYNALKVLDISKNTELRKVACFRNRLTNIIFGDNPLLEIINARSNQLTELHLDKLPSLKDLTCSYNQLKQLDVSKNTELVDIDFLGNQLSHIDLSNLSKLQRLLCHTNKLTEINLENNTLLELASIANNLLTFATMRTVTIINKSYSPQADIEIADKYEVNTPITLSTGAKEYKWVTNDGIELEKDVDFRFENGTTTFLKDLEDSVYCEMTHPDFPDLTLKTTKTKIGHFVQSINEAEMMGVKVVGGKNQITITTENAIKYSVYTTTGNIIFAQVEALAGETTIPIPQAGVYVVKVMQNGNSATQKVLVK